MTTIRKRSLNKLTAPEILGLGSIAFATGSQLRVRGERIKHPRRLVRQVVSLGGYADSKYVPGWLRERLLSDLQRGFTGQQSS